MKLTKIFTALAVIMIVIITGCKKDTFVEVDGVCPLVISTTPDNEAVNVPVNTAITATFNEDMNPATFTPTTFSVQSSLKSTDAAVTGSISYDVATKTATFQPTNLLTTNVTYSCKLAEGIKDKMGNALQTDYVWSFSTGAEIVLETPNVKCKDPEDGFTNVVLNKVISACFTIPMKAASFTDVTFTLTDGTIPVEGVVTFVNEIAYFTPSSLLTSGVTYTATLTTGVQSAEGKPLAENNAWSFTTGNVLAPTVTLIDPVDLDTDVALDKTISATFSEAMDVLTLTDLTFTVETSAGAFVPGLVELDITGTIATFTPTNNLVTDETYTATITSGAKSLASNSGLALDYVWEFSTGTHAGPLAPDLLSVARFGIIAGLGVTNAAGASAINNMDVGIYPGARSSIVGFFNVDGGPGSINNGDFYAADDADPTPAMLEQAKLDLVAVYLFAEAATDPAPSLVAGDLGGTTLTPGIYKSTSTLLIQSGDLTLDAQGDVNAVWIFQVATDFTTVGGSPMPSPTGGNVILSGGAQAKNVYWQVGISAVIGDYTSFKGNVLALTSITMNAFAVAEGRMLCQNGSIFLTSTNTITKP
jgi:hypothetical protein